MKFSDKKFYVTTPIYYASDKPHIGHASTTIAADALARYYALVLGKEKVFFLTGTDEHGNKVANYAAKDNKNPKQYVDEVALIYQDLWKSLGIDYTHFIRTTDAEHEEAVKFFLNVLKDAKTSLGNVAVYEGEYEGLYCVGCESFKRDSELVDGLCPDHKIKPEILVEKNLFFRLSDYKDALKKLIENNDLRVEPESRKNEVLSFLDQGLEDIAISRPNVAWGIPVPFLPEQTVYVWVDALVNYISAVGYGSEDNAMMAQWWPADLHLIGKDILKFHAIIWPALLIAAGLPTPKRIFAHGHFTVDGQKMSKTIGNVINPQEIIKEYGVDPLRYFMLAEIPFGEDGDFSLKRFSERYNSDLVNGLGNLVSRTLTMAEKKHGSAVPAHSGKDFDKSIKLNEDTWLKYRQLMEELKFHKALENIWNWIRCCDEYIDREKPWDGSKPDVIYDLLESIRHIAWMVRPFMPEASDKIFRQLFTDENERKEELKKTFQDSAKWGGLKAGTKIKREGIMFPRIADK